MDDLIKVVSVVGPTASGKTRLSVELAKRFNGEIISADSMQIYKNMQIATAKPTFEEMGGIVHYLIDFLPMDSSYSVAEYVKDASRCITEIRKKNKLPFIVGGTGLYVDSLLNNVTFSSQQRDQKLCDELYELYRSEGIDKLLEILSKFDFDSAKRLAEQKNAKRIIRAIEFYKTTGKTVTEQNRQSKQTPSPYDVLKIGIAYKDREVLYERINKRVDEMIERGLVKEAEAVLKSDLSFTSVKAIGYKELAPYFFESKPLDECIEKLKTETRRYAKRQITWFKRDKEINWLFADEYKSFDELLSNAISIIERGQ